MMNEAKEVKSHSTTAPPPSAPPPKGPRLRTLGLFAALGILMLWVGASWGGALGAGLHQLWGLVSSQEQSAEREEGGAGTQFYTCGMHPWVILPKPGECPICHMTLTPLDPAKFSGEIAIDPVVVQNIGVRIEPVTSGPLERSIRTVGTIDYDETAVRDINIKIDGWIEKIYVDYVGAPVEAGDTLFDLYSRQLYSAQEEYLINLRKQQQERAVEFLPRVAKDNLRNLQSSRTRLELFGIADDQIRELEKRGTAADVMAIKTPYRGVVIEKKALEGMRVNPSMRIYRIADLSRVWLMATLYEFQLPYVSLGQRAVMTLPYLPGKTFEGQVTYIYPWLEEKTREVKIRVEFDNPDLWLKPGMFAQLEIHSVLAAQRTLAPRSAVIDTGERKVSFVSLGRGKFEPRDVRTGIESGDGRIEILAGLAPGELVVTSGQFLLDSESKIRESLAKMVRGNLASEQEVVSARAGRSELDELPAELSRALSALIESYLAIHDALARDTIEEIAPASRSIAARVDELVAIEIPGAPHFWHQHDEVATIRGKALELAGATDLKNTRLHFADLSVALSKLLRASGIPPELGQEVRELHCPMFREGQGGSIWLQAGRDVRNPFFGSAMLECFDNSVTLPVTGSHALEGHGRSGTGMEEHPPGQGESAKPKVSASAQASVDRLVAAYLTIQDLLARDTLEGIEEPAGSLRKAAADLESDLAADLKPSAARIAMLLPAGEKELDRYRVAFKDLSAALIGLVNRIPPSAAVAEVLYQAHCPMVKADWLQRSPAVRNPYYGSSMLTCGSVTQTLRLDRR